MSNTSRFPINKNTTIPRNQFFQQYRILTSQQVFVQLSIYLNEVFTYPTRNRKSTYHFATPPKRHIGYIGVPITNKKPKTKVNFINTSVHNFAQIYHPDLSEAVPKLNYRLSSIDDTHQTSNFSLHTIYLTDPSTSLFTPPSLYNVQPSAVISTICIFSFHSIHRSEC